MGQMGILKWIIRVKKISEKVIETINNKGEKEDRAIELKGEGEELVR